jgi:hypothetical protein
MKFASPIVVALFVLPASGAKAQMIFTPTSGETCKDSSKEFMGDWVCPGPGGYAARFTDEGNMVGVAFAPARKVNRIESTSVWRGAGKAFGPRVGWVVKNGEPKSAVLRTWRQADAGDVSRDVQELNVYALNPGVACIYAVVDVKKPRADDIAAKYAEQAASWMCTEK